MSKKKNSIANINFILVLTIIIVMIIFSISNYSKFNKYEDFLGILDEKVVSTEDAEIITEVQEESVAELLKEFSEFGIDVGKVGLDVLRVIFVWIPLIHALLLLFFAGLSRMIFDPSSNSVTVYRTLMTFAYLNIIVTIIVLVVGVIIHFSAFKKIKMLVFALQCVAILIVNFRNTYSSRIKGGLAEIYDKVNQVPVLRASICTGEKVVGFKDLHTGKFEEVMLIKDDKDMQKFLTDYDVEEKDIKKEW